jgi:hypothetical protein
MSETRPRISHTGMEAQFQCRHCPQPVLWRAGGASRLDQHLTRVHGIDRGGFPDVAIVDLDGHVLDFDGDYVYEGRGSARRKVMPPETGIDGLIRTSKLIANIGQGGWLT